MTDSTPGRHTLAKRVLPIALLLAGILAAMALVRARPPVVTAVPEVIVPLVRVVSVREQPVSMDVTALGTVLPRTETTVAAQVAAEVTAISPSFEVGGFFEQHEILVSLDQRDYQLAIERAGALVAQNQLRLTREQAEARVAAEEWHDLGQGEADPLALREPQMAEARALLAAAEAELGQARLDLERTRIRAPFTGRIREKMVDVGQYLTPGYEVATIHAIDYAEVRLPVPDQQLAFLDLPLTYRDGSPPVRGPEAILSARFTGRRYSWRGRIVRTEGELDSRRRMIHLVARVEDPYGRGGELGRPPLAVGLFVEARIAGRTADRALVLPRSALRGEDQVLVVDGEQRLRFRTVELLRIQDEHAIVGGGLETGEQVCISPLDEVVDGMRVRTVEAEVEELPAHDWGSEAELTLPELLPLQPVSPEDLSPEDLPSNDLSVAADTAEPAPSAADPPVAEDPAAEAPATSATEALRPAPGRLLSAVITRGGTRPEIRLRIAGDYEPLTMRLKQPERFVIDLMNAVNESPRSRVEYGDGPVERLRVSQFQDQPIPVVRIVFDLRLAATSTLTRTGEGLTIGFESEDR